VPDPPPGLPAEAALFSGAGSHNGPLFQFNYQPAQLGELYFCARITQVIHTWYLEVTRT